MICEPAEAIRPNFGNLRCALDRMHRKKGRKCLKDESYCSIQHCS
jgi:hypothetical protein